MDRLTDNNFDYLIVGQGLAGSLLAFVLINRGFKIQIIDRGIEHSSSIVAAGIANPITGRNLVKSWLIDELLPKGLNLYKHIEHFFNVTIINNSDIKRVFTSVREENLWYTKKSLPEYENFLVNQQDHRSISPFCAKQLNFGTIKMGFQLDIKKMLERFRSYFIDRNILVERSLYYDNIKITPSFIQNDGRKYKGIIFCEGWKILSNPFFNYLPLNPCKGEAFVLDIPKLLTREIWKYGQFLAPHGANSYWFGSNYDWSFANNDPSEKQKELFSQKINKLFQLDYKIIDHLAGIRPTTKDRRPFLGTHPKYKNMLIFNGFGTKGVSLIPYFAERMANYLSGNVSLSKDVDIKRFNN